MAGGGYAERWKVWKQQRWAPKPCWVVTSPEYSECGFRTHTEALALLAHHYKNTTPTTKTQHANLNHMTNTQPPLKITPTPINNIHEAPNNPRIIPPKAVEIVANSIQRFGWKQPIVTTTTGEILAGHTRYRAAKKLGHTTVPVHVADDLTEEEAQAYRIADNRSSDFSSWDIPTLIDELDGLTGAFDDELALEDWDQIMASYDEAVVEYNQSNPQLPTAPESAGDSAPEEDNGGEDGASDTPTHITTELPEDVSSYLRGQGHQLTVIFDSDESLMAGRQVLLDMEGVIDVQDKRSF